MSCNKNRCDNGRGVDIEFFGNGGNRPTDVCRYNCRPDRQVIKHRHVVNYRHDIVNEYDVIHRHNYHFYDIVRQRNDSRNFDHRYYRPNYCNDGNCRDDNDNGFVDIETFNDNDRDRDRDRRDDCDRCDD